MAILAKLLSHIPERDRRKVAKQILEKFKRLPNTGYLQVWLQRIMKPSGIRLDYTERFCRIVDGTGESLWNNDWLIEDTGLHSMMQGADIVDRSKLKQVTPIMGEEEIDIFASNYQNNYQA